MNRNYFRYVLIFFAASFILFIGALLYKQRTNFGLKRGQYAFAQTRDNIRLLSHIRITTPDNGEINLYRNNNEWRFNEAKNYFVNPSRLADFYDMINHALIEAVNPTILSELENLHLTNQTGTQITTYDENNKALDTIIIGNRYDKNSVYAYSSDNKNFFYVIGPVTAFSGQPKDWIPYPLLSIDERLIRKMIIRGNIFEGKKLAKLMESSLNMKKVLGVLSFIGYDGVSLQSELEQQEQTAAIEPRTLEIFMANGLIYDLKIYKIEDLYWLKITLKADKIAQKGISLFVKQNQKYFSNWLFLMNTRQGKTLYEM